MQHAEYLAHMTGHAQHRNHVENLKEPGHPVHQRVVLDPVTGQQHVLTGKKAKETVSQADMKKLMNKIDVNTIGNPALLACNIKAAGRVSIWKVVTETDETEEANVNTDDVVKTVDPAKKAAALAAAAVASWRQSNPSTMVSSPKTTPRRTPWTVHREKSVSWPRSTAVTLDDDTDKADDTWGSTLNELPTPLVIVDRNANRETDETSQFVEDSRKADISDSGDVDNSTCGTPRQSPPLCPTTSPMTGEDWDIKSGGGTSAQALEKLFVADAKTRYKKEKQMAIFHYTLRNAKKMSAQNGLPLEENFATIEAERIRVKMVQAQELVESGLSMEDAVRQVENGHLRGKKKEGLHEETSHGDAHVAGGRGLNKAGWVTNKKGKGKAANAQAVHGGYGSDWTHYYWYTGYYPAYYGQSGAAPYPAPAYQSDAFSQIQTSWY